MRLIDADALKKDWRMANKCEECQQDTRRCQYEQNFSRMDICEMLDEAPTVGNWINVNDRLPEESGEVLAVWVSRYGIQHMVVVEYSSKHKAFNASDCLPDAKCKMDEVTHWMPLPELPKENDNEGD